MHAQHAVPGALVVVVLSPALVARAEARQKAAAWRSLRNSRGRGRLSLPLAAQKYHAATSVDSLSLYNTFKF